jgi:hypothetical protein
MRLALFAALALTGVAACGAFTSTPPGGGGPTTADAGLDGRADAPPSGPDAGPQLPIRKSCDGVDVFCDDFEAPGAVTLPGKWDSDFGGRMLDVVSGQGEDGSAGLRVELRGAVDDTLQQGFLRKNRPGSAPARFTTIVAFSANVTLDNGAVDGPKLRTDLNSGGSPQFRDVSVRWSDLGRNVELSYVDSGCKVCAPPPPEVATIALGWHAYTLVVSVGEPDQPSRNYGRVTLFVDGGVVIDGPLGLDMGGATERALLFGVSRASAPVKGTILLDDAYLEFNDSPPP